MARGHSCFLSSHGEIKCVGVNDAGALGYEDDVDKGLNPMDMGDNLDVVNLGTDFLAKRFSLSGMGADHTCAADANAIDSHTQWKCWGFNTFGQLGYGDTFQRYVQSVIVFSACNSRRVITWDLCS